MIQGNAVLRGGRWQPAVQLLVHGLAACQRRFLPETPPPLLLAVPASTHPGVRYAIAPWDLLNWQRSHKRL